MPNSAQSPVPSITALRPQEMVELFESLPEVAFFVKDAGGRYTAVNLSLIRRAGLHSRDDLLGKTVREIFPLDLAQRFEAQDEEVIRTGRPVRDQLELHWYANRRPGWCLTTKLPLHDAHGNVTGLVGISRDVPAPGKAPEIPAAIMAAMTWLQDNFGESLTTHSLAAHAGMNPIRFARLVKQIYALTPQQLIIQTRLQAAASLLESSSRSIAEIAVACGFADHSAFTRAFKAASGCTPTHHRVQAVSSRPAAQRISGKAARSLARVKST